MIHVIRTPEPPILTKKANKWLKEYLNAIKTFNANPIAANKEKKKNAEKKYNHYQIKIALKNMFFRKCDYCESHVLHIDYGHIEHYKPKSMFPDQCFDWENLLLGCSVCNGPEYKSNHFPLSNQKGPIINPTIENPSDFLRFEFDPKTGTANIIDKYPRGLTTKSLLGLNRPDLVRHRSSVVKMMVFAAIKASNGDNAALLEIKRCCNKDEEYSAFAIELCNHFNLH